VLVSSLFNYKGSSIASFIIFSFLSFCSPAKESSPLVQEALSKNLDKSLVWQSLLHAKEGQENIFDTGFLLSGARFSLENELNATINFLFNNESSKTAICRFPARYLWLSKQLNLQVKSFTNCLRYEKFKSLAPLDDLHLIYASENLVSPSSMMGHIFLKTQGKNIHQHEVSHSLSFFTEVEGFNVPKLIFESVFLGKKGYFSLNPYHEKERIYLSEEQRNVWSYLLTFSDWQKELLQAHLWELKDTQLSYFFHDYNCATFTLYVLAVADSRFLDFISSIDSPLDVAKAAKKLNLIEQTSLTPSNKWKTRMLNDALSSKDVSITKAAVKNRDLSPLVTSLDTSEQIYLKNELASTYAYYLFEEEVFAKGTLNGVLSQADDISKSLNQDFTIGLSEYKDPLKSQDDTQLYSGFVSIEGQEYLQIGFLAAAKKREDDSRQYFGETDLRLFDLSLLLSLEKEPRLELDEFSLYAVSALMPWDELTGGISGRFNLGAKTHFNKDLERGSALDISGGLGLSYQLVKDVLTYSLFNAGHGLRAGKSYLYTEPEIGFVVNEVFDMKSILSFNHIWNQDKSGDAYLKLNFNQSLYLNKAIGFFLGYERVWKDDLKQERFDMRLKYYF
tara:strand:+ start:22554 stop:24410 length:1857 start_codon:yes stop_codon:yes gene_type:complete